MRGLRIDEENSEHIAVLNLSLSRPFGLISRHLPSRTQGERRFFHKQPCHSLPPRAFRGAYYAYARARVLVQNARMCIHIYEGGPEASSARWAPQGPKVAEGYARINYTRMSSLSLSSAPRANFQSRREGRAAETTRDVDGEIR